MKKLVSVILLFFIGFNIAQAQKNTPLTIASYNIRMSTERDGENAWSKRKENVKALIRYHDFDIIGTQEGFIAQINNVLELPEFAYTGKGRDDGKDGGEHSAIIYRKDRFKLLDSGDFWLSETPDKPGKGWDAKCCNRIASWGKFKDLKTKKEFYFFNVHFDHEGVVARRESGKLIVKKINEIAGKNTVILTGDFNSTPEMEQIKTISSMLNDSYTVTKQPPYGPVGTFNAFKFDAPMKDRIDYIFTGNNIDVLKYGVLTDSKDQKYPSDHQPVVIKAIIK